MHSFTMSTREVSHSNVKTSKKRQLRGHVYFQAVRLAFFSAAFNWLTLNNSLSTVITINMEQISEDLTSTGQDTNAPSINEVNETELLLTQHDMNQHDKE